MNDVVPLHRLRYMVASEWVDALRGLLGNEAEFAFKDAANALCKLLRMALQIWD